VGNPHKVSYGGLLGPVSVIKEKLVACCMRVASNKTFEALIEEPIEDW
jgi:hypothetical protein